ncbi:ABC transporter permease [Kitasatospora sp. NPDC088346]|uniref:ABC transporter permease subunit n=1 Tax=Kitasatospora sp. NPDC088346 TaxID=3364073 RepID=UPI0037F1E666
MADTLGLTLDLLLAGLAVGSAAALSGVGLIVTYRATGVLNLAQGAQAMLIAYLLRELVVVRHWPLGLAAVCCLLVVAPALGVLLELAVFRPLQRRGAGPAETLVAAVGVFVLLIGAAVLIWGTTPFGDAPALAPATVLARPGGHPLRLDTLAQLAGVLLLTGTVALVTRHTGLGVRLRAVVDNRRLAALAGIDADRVSAGGWAFGSFTAGLVGVLLAPYLLLDPYGLPLLVLETMAVAVAARLRSLPVAVATGLVLGVLQSEFTRWRPPGQLLPLAQAMQANLFVVALLAAALLPWRGALGADRGIPVPRRGSAPAGAKAACLLLLLLPLWFRADDLRHALAVPALALVLLSTVVVTGYGGQVSLGQAGYAGIGGLGTALLLSGRVPGLPALPAVPALLLAVAAAVPFGLLTGWPAIRRRGLALALTTLAVGTALSRLVFEQPYATSGLDLAGGAVLPGGDRALYVLELVLLGAALLLVRNLHRGRLGRALTALADHQAAASAAGVDVPRLKLLLFMAGAGVAALGGALTTLAGQSFDPNAYDPVRGLLWFAAAVVAGVDSAAGAVAAAAALTALDTLAGVGVSAVVVGAGAVAIGRLPGGLAGLARARRAAPARTLTPLGRRIRARLPDGGPR